MEAAGRAEIRAAAPEARAIEIRHGADMRYVGQEHAVSVDVPGALFRARDVAGIKAVFDAAHEERYGYASADEAAEIVSLRCSVIGEMPKPALERIPAGGAAPESGARTGERPVYFTGQGFVPTPAFDRRAARGGQPHRRAGARGGIRLHDRGAARRGARGRPVRQPVDRGVRVMNESAAGRTRGLDPVLTEIVRNGLIAATEEMKTNLMRTAYNLIIYEALDFTVGLLDAQGNTVSIGLGLPMFIRGMSDTAKAKLAHFGGAAGLEPGDVLLTNDAYLTGSHLNHMTFSVPVFWEGELLGFSSCMAHWQDIGGAIGGMTARHLRRGPADADREVLSRGHS